MEKKHRGAAGEALATAWLLGCGYEVFRNVSQHGDIDLVIRGRDGFLLPVDVKSAAKYAVRSGDVLYSKPPKAAPGVLVLVADVGELKCWWGSPLDKAQPFEAQKPIPKFKPSKPYRKPLTAAQRRELDKWSLK